MRTATNNRTWKKIAAFAMSLTVMCGVAGALGNSNIGSTFVASAEEAGLHDVDQLHVDENITILPCQNGSVTAELVEGDDQEFNAILIKPVPDDGYKVAAVYVNDAQVAINDKDEYLVAYDGGQVTITADFVEDDGLGFEILDCDHGTVSAERVEDDDQEFNAVLVTATPDEGYKLAAVYANGEQVAINDQDEYVIDLGAYGGQTVYISAEFVEDNGERFEVLECEHGHIDTELVEDENQEFNGLRVIPVPDEGYKLAGVYVNGMQMAINDFDDYIINLSAFDGETIYISAEFVEDNGEPFEIAECEHGTVKAELVEGDDQEFNAILITPVPDAGYKVEGVYINGEQIAINDKDEYLVSLSFYEGKPIVISAKFVADGTDKGDTGTKGDDTVPKTGAAAAAGLGAAAAVAAAAVIIARKRK
ncbi:MAG: hypothetical protein IKN17_02240 [Ruminococcus sp.]|nr:hypothetical protein [Ruminococcus sp.]